MSLPSSPAPRPTSRPEVVLFHSVLGIRPNVTRFADRLRADGYVVHVPDLYRGASFDSYEAGMQHVESIGGIEALMERTHEVTAHLSANQVYAGYSNGGASAQLLAQTREGARGALLLHAALPVEVFGAAHWPSTVPVQVHYASHDPFREQDGIDALAASVQASGASYEFFEYDGHGHLFCDEGLTAEYNVQHCERMTKRVLEFLARLG